MSDPFEQFDQVAFRVEALPDYPAENGPSQSMLEYEKTGHVPDSHNEEWAQIVAAAMQRGTRVERLRLIHEPLSRYEKYEIKAGYDAGVSAGEDIRIAKLAGQIKQPLFDFWVFDSHIMREMKYDADGRFHGFEDRQLTSSDQEMVRYWREVWSQAEALSAYRRHFLI